MHATIQAFAGLLAVFAVIVAINVAWQQWGGGPVDEQAGPIRTGLRIDVNTADAADLTLLPGIGPGIAQHILDARAQGAVFHNSDELQTVRFVGPSVAERIEPWVAYQSN